MTLLFFGSSTLQAQCQNPIQVLQTDFICNDDGDFYGIEFMLNRQDVIVVNEAYEMLQKVSGEIAFYGISYKEELIVALETEDGCSLIKTFQNPNCRTSFDRPNSVYNSNNSNRKRILTPTAFTPNNDGVNDFFKYAGDNIISLNIKVVNRWGELVFQSNQIQAAWDGYWNGRHQPAGVYPYFIEVVFEDGSSAQKQSQVTLIR